MKKSKFKPGDTVLYTDGFTEPSPYVVLSEGRRVTNWNIRPTTTTTYQYDVMDVSDDRWTSGSVIAVQEWQVEGGDDKREMKVATSKRSDGYNFYVVTWREKGKDKTLVSAGCRRHRGVKSALGRWKDDYRLDDTGYDRKFRKALNVESRKIVKTLAKQVGLKVEAPKTTSGTKLVASRDQSSRRSAASSPAKRPGRTVRKRKASTRKA